MDIEELLEDDSEQKRRYPRRPIKWKALIKDTSQDKVVPATTVNVSEQGALLQSIFCFKKLQLLPIMIKVNYQGNKLTIYAKAEVRHIIIRTYDFQLGLLFKDIQKNDQQFLSRFAEGI
ncbi:PilZ domain-containing protein [Endozoicomonas sp. SM1973]|uniref:PilZ domain-containing protein n=1 Tax=Spartinivicinus marinus TaxID=2994442 RepID=A0A853I7U4_9GAMM|nr:PilZ domain-containing protein [Spartinivicinus marinus]NYZ69383.1 PilZ domain-containing protein [Spartinivicinus marinus]